MTKLMFLIVICCDYRIWSADYYSMDLQRLTQTDLAKELGAQLKRQSAIVILRHQF